jgi:ubiquinone/menaquinone biosynthesis C-methylase UbiE
MDYKEHKEYFETAYRTGSDIWTHLPMKDRGAIFLKELPLGSLILDVGSGRGLFAKQLAEFGYSVIGLDFVGEIVNKNNKEIKHWGLEGKLNFVEGSVFDIPFTNDSFDGVCDFGLMDNLYKEDWAKYADEIIRVLKPGGFYLNTSLSRETQKFLEFRPKSSDDGEFEKYGIHYHFFDKQEMKKIFDHDLTPVEQDIEFIEKPKQVALVKTLFQKKK